MHKPLPPALLRVLACWALALLALVSPACAQRRGALSPKRMLPHQTEKFKLSAIPGAAKGYPMTIQVGNFIRSDGKTFPVPSGHILRAGWTGIQIRWAVGDELQPAPDSLEMLYFSYLEDTFYEGRFALPQQQIHELLKQGYWDRQAGQQVTYNHFVVSVLPAGRVVVWLAGAGEQVLVGRYRAAPAPHTDFRRFYRTADRAEMWRDALAEAAPAVRQQAQQHTLTAEQWDAYFALYPWQVAANVPVSLYRPHVIKYVNGEKSGEARTRDGMAAYNDALFEARPRPAPAYLHFYFLAEHEAKYFARVDAFDEAETRAAFQRLAGEHPNAPITLLFTFDKFYEKATVSLKNQWREIPLLKSTVELKRK
jgi:hypothetical protein